jgi:hypothetical protein
MPYQKRAARLAVDQAFDQTDVDVTHKSLNNRLTRNGSDAGDV